MLHFPLALHCRCSVYFVNRMDFVSCIIIISSLFIA